MRKPRETLFQILCVGASAILLVMSLLYAVRLTACSQHASELKTAVETLREENQILRVRSAFRWNLEEIERYARAELGMQPLSAEQIIRTEITG